MNEDKLIKRAQKGDGEAFGELYNSYLSPIYRFIFLRVKEKAEAEDITQQVFLKAWKNIESFQYIEGARFSSWLYKIAKNAVIDHYRTSKNDIDIELVSEKNLPLELNVDQETKIDTEIKIKLVKSQLNKLTGDEQNVIIMKFVNDMKNDEISSTLNKSQGAVRVIQHRALKKLKEYLRKNDNG